MAIEYGNFYQKWKIYHKPLLIINCNIVIKIFTRISFYTIISDDFCHNMNIFYYLISLKVALKCFIS